MLRAWASEFGNDPEITLHLYAPDEDPGQIDSRLERAWMESGSPAPIDRRRIRPFGTKLSDAEAVASAGFGAYHSVRYAGKPFDRLPWINRTGFPTLRSLCGVFQDEATGSEGPPDFIGVAAQKAGTTWWGELIRRHPAVHRSARFRKEAHFFTAFRGFAPESVPVEKYARLFVRPPGKTVGEWTPGYAREPQCAEMLKLAAPDAKILALLRDPIERYISGLTHRVKHGEPLGRRAEQMALESGLYGQQLKQILESFPREQLLILQYERCCLEPREQLARTYRFLQLPDPGFVPENLTAPVHATSIEKVTISDETRSNLVHAYRPDSTLLSSLFPDLDLGLWRTLGRA